MVVVNGKDNLPKQILCLGLGKGTTPLKSLLDSLTLPGKRIGVKRNNYYLLTIDAAYNAPSSKEFIVLMRIIRKAAPIYTYIMFNCK